MEQQIKITAKLYDCRDTAKRFFKEEFQDKVKPYIYAIRMVMKAKKLNELKALLEISKTPLYQENVMTQMLFLAAVCEMIEPSK
jgi:predicted nucleotidyltransferase